MLNNNCLESEVYMKRKIYESPLTLRTEVETEGGFMEASIFGKEDGHDEGLTIEEHGFADPTVDWEGDYTTGENAGWDN